MVQVPRDQTSFRHPITVVDSNNVIAPGLHYLSLITFAYKRPTDALWKNVAVKQGTSTFDAGGFRELSEDSGVYEFCWPDAAIVAGECTLIRYVYDGVTRIDSIDARLPSQFGLSETEVDNIVTEIVAAIQPANNAFQGGQVSLGDQISLRVKQRDDYSVTDGRAFQWTITNPAIDFSNASVSVGAAGGGKAAGEPIVVGTPTLVNKANGSAGLRLEFTSAQLNVPPDRYYFDIHFTVSSRRITPITIELTVDPKYADAPPS